MRSKKTLEKVLGEFFSDLSELNSEISRAKKLDL